MYSDRLIRFFDVILLPKLIVEPPDNPMNFTNSSGFESGSGEVDIESSNFLSEIYYIPGTFSIYYNVPRLIMDLIRPGSLPYGMTNFNNFLFLVYMTNFNNFYLTLSLF